MSYTKRLLVPLAVASILTINTNLSGFALANTDLTDVGTPLPSTPAEGGQGETTTTTPPSGSGNTTGSVVNKPSGSVTCAEAQNAINNINGKGNVNITEDCMANLVIPSGKTVSLSLRSGDSHGVFDIAFYTLSNAGGDTITVEKGATLILDDEFNSGAISEKPILTNSTKEKTIIKNYGTTYILRGGFNTTNGAKLIANSGELNVLGGVYANAQIQNTGAIRVVSGQFENVNAIRQYVVKGSTIDESTRKVLSGYDDEYGDPLLAPYVSDALINFDRALPVGYHHSAKTDYADRANAFGIVFYSTDESVLKVTGSNSEGWAFEVVGPGRATLMFGNVHYIGGVSGHYFTSSYQLPQDTTNNLGNLLSGLVDQFGDKIHQATEAGKIISINVEVGTKTDGTSVAEEQKTEIAKITGKDKVLGYYDITVALKGGNDKLANITDLGDDTVDVRMSDDFTKGVEAVKPGYTRSYYVVRVHNGVAEKIDTKLENNKLTFKSGKFSTYAVAYNDTKTSNGDNSNGASPNTNSATGTPNTGVTARSGNDGARVATTGAIVFILASSLAAAIVIIKKRQQSEK